MTANLGAEADTYLLEAAARIPLGDNWDESNPYQHADLERSALAQTAAIVAAALAIASELRTQNLIAAMATGVYTFGSESYANARAGVLAALKPQPTEGA